eukprot:15433099-Alexandrium_andersonii.AAC.1
MGNKTLKGVPGCPNSEVAKSFYWPGSFGAFAVEPAVAFCYARSAKPGFSRDLPRLANNCASVAR